MIKESYCSFEVSKLLKEKGFDEPCCGRYSIRSKEFHLDCTKMCNNGGLFECAAPTHQMAMAWLREKYISIVIDDDEIPLSYKYIIKKYSINDNYKVLTLKLDSLPFIKYEDAVEAALKYVLENLI